MTETLIITASLLFFIVLNYLGYRLKYGALLVAILPYLLFITAIVLICSDACIIFYPEVRYPSKASYYEMMKSFIMSGFLFPAPLYSIAGAALSIIKIRQECYARDIAALALSIVSLILLFLLLFTGTQVIHAA